VWAAANAGLKSITLDTDTTVHMLYGRQMGARKGYHPKNKGKKSYQPILTFIAETHEYIWEELRHGDRPDEKQIARHLQSVIVALPKGVREHLRPGRLRFLLLRGCASLPKALTATTPAEHKSPERKILSRRPERDLI
jgi:hypothetical protein